MKEVIEREKEDSAIATEQPTVAIDPNASSSSIVVQSFFRSKLCLIKKKQLYYDQHFDKTIAQLQQLEELLYCA